MFKKFNAWAATKLVGLKTKIWNGFLAVSSAALVAMQMFDVIDLRSYIDAKIAGWIMLAIAASNYWLREITKIEHEMKK